MFDRENNSSISLTEFKKNVTKASPSQPQGGNRLVLRRWARKIGHSNRDRGTLPWRHADAPILALQRSKILLGFQRAVPVGRRRPPPCRHGAAVPIPRKSSNAADGFRCRNDGSFLRSSRSRRRLRHCPGSDVGGAGRHARPASDGNCRLEAPGQEWPGGGFSGKAANGHPAGGSVPVRKRSSGTPAGRGLCWL